MNFQLLAFCLLAFAYRAEAQCTVVTIANGTPSTAVGSDVADAGTLTVTCNAGYAASAASVTCNTNTFSGTLTCDAITCAATTITNGVGTTGATAYNGQHIFTCNAGYALTGTATLTCDGTESNNWSTAVPTCVASCNAAPTLTQGTFPTIPTGGYSGTVSITCNAGYISASGAATSATCSATNTWTPTSLTCTAATCNAAPTLTQGTIPTMPSGGYTGTVSITCNGGYTVATGDASSSLCTTTNTWNPTALTCTVSQTASLCNAAPTLTQGTFPTMPSGGYTGSVSITCNAGYISASGTATSATCSATNTWTPASLTCTAATCNAAPTLTQGTFPTMPTAGYTGTVAITCNSGYKAGSTNSSNCSDTNTWNPTSVTCAAITCSALTVTNGAVAPTGTVAYNGEVTVTCDSGYTLSSTTGDLKCDGTLANNYNATTPTCTATTTVSTTAGSASLFHLHTALMAMLLSAFAFIKAL